MTNEEADVMRRMLKYCYGASSDVDAVLTEAHQLLAQHADDQIATDLPWLVENYEGHGAGDEQDWTFWSDDEMLVGICCMDCETTATICMKHTIPCATRGDVRRLPAGLLVMKKKEGV